MITPETLDNLLRGLDAETLAISVNREKPNDAFLHTTHNSPVISVRALVQEVQRLRADNENLSRRLPPKQVTEALIQMQQQTRQEVDSELAELRKDRERLDWMIEKRAKILQDSLSFDSSSLDGAYAVDILGRKVSRSKTPREAIDASMEAEKR